MWGFIPGLINGLIAIGLTMVLNNHINLTPFEVFITTASIAWFLGKYE